MLIRLLDHLESLPADWEFVNLSTSAKHVPFGEPIFDIYRPCRFEGYSHTSVAYLIRNSGAKKLLDHVYPIRWFADGLTARPHITGLITYGIHPPVAAHGNFASTIWTCDDTTFTRSRYWQVKAIIRLGFREIINTLLRRIKGERLTGPSQ